MFIVKKQIEVSASHSLQLSYESKCTRLHGHNWVITVFCRANVLDSNGMVVDFGHIKQTIVERMDHQNLNEVFDFNPTAENIAAWICHQIPKCFRVEVQESANNVAVYERD